LSKAIEERSCRFQIGRVETFGEAAVDRLEEHRCVGGPVLIAQQPGKARGGAQSLGQSGLPTRPVEGLSKVIPSKGAGPARNASTSFRSCWRLTARSSQKRASQQDVAGPGLVVSGENLKVQIARLRKALGAHRNLIGTEFGSGYRFIGVLRSNATAHACRGPGE
jgi:hypothetical protein